MKINLNYSKLIKVEVYPNDSVIDVPDHCTVRDLLALLKLPGYVQRAAVVHVNGEPVWLATVIKENDSVKIFRAVSGG
jgi:sulfur carrier protein ThiS